MRAAGIIAEYNPFHNGHERHIALTRRQTGCDMVIVALNGSVSQRGEMMLLDKWRRTQMALQGGADIVVELPTLWGARPAQDFALGGVAILHALGCSWLSFGCESDDTPLLGRIAALMDEEPPEYRAVLKAALAEGKSFPRARAEAVRAVTGAPEELLSGPNAALAIEYLRAVRRTGSDMQPVAVLRTAPHHSSEIAEHTSASAIRAAVLSGNMEQARVAMPPQSYNLLSQGAGAIARPESFDIALLMVLRAMDRERLAVLPDVSEGLENVLFRACREAGTRAELLEKCKSRRYTHARLSRIAAHAAIGTDRSLLQEIPLPRYIRLLGVRRHALAALGELQKNSALPVIGRAKALEGDECFALERRATDLRALCAADSAERAADSDLRQKLLITD